MIAGEPHDKQWNFLHFPHVLHPASISFKFAKSAAMPDVVCDHKHRWHLIIKFFGMLEFMHLIE